MTRPRLLTRAAALPLALALALTGCSAASDTATSAPDADNADVAKATAALKELQGTVLSKGPNGEEPASATEAELTPEQVAQVKAKKATAAIAMHYGGDDWSASQIKALRSEFQRLGIEVVAVTDANFKPDKQVSDLETIMTKKPDIIVSLPTDPVATSSAYKKVAQAGVKLVFMDNSPKGLKAGTDYVSVVSADNYGNGVTSAHLMAKELGGKGEIGLIFHEADFFVTRQRYDGFKKTITDDYPNIKIVEETGIAGPDFAGDAQAAASAMLGQHPEPVRHLGRLGRARRGCARRSARLRARRPEGRHAGPRQERGPRAWRSRTWSWASALSARTSRASPRPGSARWHCSGSRRRRTSP